MARFKRAHKEVRPRKTHDSIYDNMLSVEVVNNEVLSGVPFREAYRKVGLDIEAGRFSPSRTIRHTHEGSIGNLCTEQINERFKEVMARFDFDRALDAEAELVRENC